MKNIVELTRTVAFNSTVHVKKFLYSPAQLVVGVGGTATERQTCLQCQITHITSRF